MKKHIKQIAKDYLPEPVKKQLIGLNRFREQLIIFRYDKNRFLHAYSPRKLKRNSQSQLDARITFHAHSLEKGLSHNVVRLGFGSSALKQLAKCLVAYNALGYPKTDKAYINSMSVLREYIDLHDKKKFDTSYLLELFGEELIMEAAKTKSQIGGIRLLAIAEKAENSSLSFKELFSNRWSVREYANSKVDLRKIYEAISIATKTPSICNRQPSRVVVITDKDKIDDVLKVQNGMTGYDTPPVLLMVSTDSSAFVDLTERNQIYIDGGLFSMSLLLALESVSLAACPLNAMFTVSRDKKIRKILDLPKNENIIMFVSVGNFIPSSKVPKSFRYSGDEISRTIKGHTTG